MNRPLAAMTTAALLTLAAPATAQTLSFGLGVTTDYLSRGASQTGGGAALQPWVEYETNGFYVGAWASNVDLAPDSVELDLLAGYRWSVENTDFDLGYARYIYNSSGDAGSEVFVLMTHNLGETGASFFFGAYAGHAGGWSLNDVHAGFSFPVMDRLSGSVKFGMTPGGANNYGDIGLTYAVNDTVEVDFRIHSGSTLPTQAVLSTAISF